MQQMIFATKNKGKIKEIKAILSDLPLEVLSMEEAGITIDVVEDGATFEENALKKAVEIAKISGKLTMADDSGLEIDFFRWKARCLFCQIFGRKYALYRKKCSYIIFAKRSAPTKKRRKICQCYCSGFS